MKIYTKSDMENFERYEDGCLICPTGDYSQIRKFDERCVFGDGCIFGAASNFESSSRFGKYCRFGADSDFGVKCNFGDQCSFDKWCRFGAWCDFGNNSIFGGGCSFGWGSSFGMECHFDEQCVFVEGCVFNDGCSFDEQCIFGECCIFGEKCSFECGNVKNGTYFACDRIGSKRRKTYFFRATDGKMYVRAGCWFSSIDEFVERVKKAHGGTKYEKEYLAAVELAKIVLEG